MWILLCCKSAAERKGWLVEMDGFTFNVERLTLNVKEEPALEPVINPKTIRVNIVSCLLSCVSTCFFLFSFASYSYV